MKKYTTNEQPILSQDTLNIKEKVRSNLFTWKGQFSPQFVESHLETYSKPGDYVLDPFVGSGTVLVECARKNNAAFGAEINPAAAIMSRTYTLSFLNKKNRRSILKNVDKQIAQLDNYEDIPLFSTSNKNCDLRKSLLDLVQAKSNKSAERYLLETLVVILDFHTGSLTSARLRSTWGNLRQLVENLPKTKSTISVALTDSRSLPLENQSVDLVLTSPPYINVFNYHQQYRASVEALNWDVLPMARSEIGSNRKHRGNRFLTVIQYCLDMAMTFVELTRVCKPGARAIFIVGRESNVRKTSFYNGNILRRVANECLGIQILLEQERVFQNRFGQNIYEDILHFELKPITLRDFEDRVRELAMRVLLDAKKRAPIESLEDLQDAITKINSVEPSPLVNSSKQNDSLLRSFWQNRNRGN